MYEYYINFHYTKLTEVSGILSNESYTTEEYYATEDANGNERKLYVTATDDNGDPKTYEERWVDDDGVKHTAVRPTAIPGEARITVS